MLPLEILADDKWRWLLMVLNDEHVAVGRGSPVGIASPDGDTVDAVDEAPLRVAVVKADVGVRLQSYVGKSIAFEDVSLIKTTTILSIVGGHWAESLTILLPLVKSLKPVRRYLPIFLRLLATFLHLVPFLFQYEV